MEPKLPMRNTYDLLARYYDKLWARYNRATSAEVLRVFPKVLEGARVLDVGAGTGFFAVQLLRKHSTIGEIVALDSSREMLKVARRKLQNTSHARLCFVQGEAEILPFVDGSFDFVVSMNTLHYLRNPRQFFNETNRVLDVGGTLVVQDYTRNSWPFFELAARLFDSGTQRLYAPSELSKLAEDAGFKVRRARTFRISWFWRGVLLTAEKM